MKRLMVVFFVLVLLFHQYLFQAISSIVKELAIPVVVLAVVIALCYALLKGIFYFAHRKKRRRYKQKKKWYQLKKKVTKEAKDHEYEERNFIDNELKNDCSNLPNDFSDDPKHYLINKDSFVRDNAQDAIYKLRWRKILYYLYDYKCPFCQKPCTDIDHFFIPKSLGGNFKLKTKNGYVVNNAVPLCNKCNIKKSNKHFSSFVSYEQFVYIEQRNMIMSKLLRVYKHL
ncbi:MAG: HNH endonuclease signature motif containing protein [Methanobrevibacter sp.]|nr:HNH endonuclease signature motif containing protein [Methanobrevibacter sp.]